MTTHQQGISPAEDSIYLDGDCEEHSGDVHQEQVTLLSPEQEECLLSQEEDEDHALELSSWKNLPWWKRPSPYWLIFASTFRAIATFAAIAPTVTLYTDLVCHVHSRPTHVMDDQRSLVFPLTDTLAKAGIIVPISQVSDDVATVGGGVFVHLPDGAYRTATLDYTQVNKKKCTSDPVVQATVAKLHAVSSTTIGILSCLTTGWWGSLSDRYGRRIVLFTSAFGHVAINVVRVLLGWYVDVLPGRYWFLLVGSVIDGLCGGMSTALAMKQSYVADTTDSSTRSQYFSLSLGLTFVGEAVGPVLSGLLIRSTGSILSVFYAVSAIHGLYAISILLILPESLTRARARGARLRWRKVMANKASSAGTSDALKTATSFLGPLVVLLPKVISGGNPLERRRKDWSLFCIAVAYGLSASLIGFVPYKIQYAAAQFNWTPEFINYFLSFLGVTRAFFLVVILPLIIKCFQPSVANSLASSTDAPKRALRPSTSPTVDLRLARISIALGGVQYLGMAVASTGTLYTLANMMGSLAAGFGPAVESLALEIYSKRPQDKREVGKLFGAFNVIHAFSAGIISPALYGSVYSNTVAVFPQAVMIVSTCTSCFAFLFTLFVHVPSDSTRDPVLLQHGNDSEEGSQCTVVTPEVLVQIEDEADA